jgi:NAD(P)-dependent dehydrogenase (short-subunit alcohol dehydrogenase family)
MSDQVKYTQKLKGDRILVIGGSSGLGFAAAEACVENGCTVIISSSNPDRVAKTVEKLKSSYPSAKVDIERISQSTHTLKC